MAVHTLILLVPVRTAQFAMYTRRRTPTITVTGVTLCLHGMMSMIIVVIGVSCLITAIKRLLTLLVVQAMAIPMRKRQSSV